MEKGATGVAFGGRVGAKPGGRGWSLFGARVHMGLFRGEKKRQRSCCDKSGLFNVLE